jgi:hypothetical protein
MTRAYTFEPTSDSIMVNLWMRRDYATRPIENVAFLADIREKINWGPLEYAKVMGRI